MKAVYIYASRLRAFWVLVPMSMLLMLSISFNDTVDGAIKLYPLILFSIGAIIFTFVYLFRFISVSYSEIKYIGRFTSRDSATVNAGKTLVIDILEKKRVSVRLFGNEGYNPEIKWLTNEDGEDGDVCLFRGKAYGGESVAISLLRYFGVEDYADLDAILSEDGFVKSYENVTVRSLTELEHRQIRIKFDKTV
ncbi:MAG: hypothetical protein IJW53_03495 [Clostridia bacterium]|nr:hypothetical protein [Clostridia bacterium]